MSLIASLSTYLRVGDTPFVIQSIINTISIIIIIIMDRSQAHTLWLKALDNTDIIKHMIIMYIEIETVINLTKS